MQQCKKLNYLRKGRDMRLECWEPMQNRRKEWVTSCWYNGSCIFVFVIKQFRSWSSGYECNFYCKVADVRDMFSASVFALWRTIWFKQAVSFLSVTGKTLVTSYLEIYLSWPQDFKIAELYETLLCTEGFTLSWNFSDWDDYCFKILYMYMSIMETK